ncbi:radical SAM protein [Thermodesulfobacteriota bacterium]
MAKNQYVTRIRSDHADLWRGKLPLLQTLDIELTERCNNNCIHCSINLPADNQLARNKELSPAKIKDVLKEAAALGCMKVRFTGGEPLLREDFEALYLFARQLGLTVLLFTNATLISARLSDIFSHIPPLEKIEITVYGMNKTSYEAVTRTPGSFEAAFRGINLLEKKKIPFVVKSAILPPNINDIKAFETWAATIPWMEGPPSYAMFFDLRSRHDSTEKNRRIKKLRLSPENGLKVLTRKRNEYVRGLKAFSQQFMAPPGFRLFTCSAGKGSGCLDAYGFFQPCLLLRHPQTVYDLQSGSLRDALGRFFPAVRKIKATDSDYINQCSQCFLAGLCDQCPAKSWIEHGALDRPVEYLCEIAHTQARYLGLLENNEVAWQVKDWRERIKTFIGKDFQCQAGIEKNSCR